MPSQQLTSLLVLSTVVTLIAITTALWLAHEHKKKFDFMAQFIASTPGQMITHHYPGTLNRLKCGMRDIVLHADTPFTVLVGFELEYPILGGAGFDYYGFVHSRPHVNGHIAVIRTYHGKGPVTFQFLANRSASDIVVDKEVADEPPAPSAIYPPHWYQRLGFFG